MGSAGVTLVERYRLSEGAGAETLNVVCRRTP
jgi:hypothetical protein